MPFVDKTTATARHREYYAQLVDEETIDSVVRFIGERELLASTDFYLNDIPLDRWDALAGATARGMNITWHGHRPLRTAIKFEELGDYATLAGLVCVAKEAARQWLEQQEDAE